MASTKTMQDSIRSFEQKVMNRSVMDLLCFDGLADYMLECCNAEAKANTLSFLSFLPLFIANLLISGPSRLGFLLGAIAIFMHQILDIANKKQAYRLQSFSFGTYYFDHTCDSVSCLLIVYLMGKLLAIPGNWIWLGLFFFAVLPFYLHHLTMYYGEYMCFQAISPVTEGIHSVSQNIYRAPSARIAVHCWSHRAHYLSTGGRRQLSSQSFGDVATWAVAFGFCCHRYKVNHQF